MAASAAQAGETLDRVHKTGVVVDALVNDYPPFAFINDKNELDGFDVDVAKAFAEKLGAKLKLESPGWETIVGGKWAGRWDVGITSTTPTEDRAKVLNFPVIYYSVPAVLVVNSQEQTIKSVADISGKRVGVGSGSSYEAYVNRNFTIPGQPAIEFPFHDVQVVPGDETVNFQNLALGPGVRLDAIVASAGTAKGQIDATGKLKVLGDPLFAEPNAIVTDKGDPEWDAEVKRVIVELKTGGKLAAISNKWFGVDITKNVD
ncbi:MULTISPECIES: transporter substrate-binding domain-containing protein [unclassified Mesorhizobium]|uniref:transporter substrate-binding domain-containing protein n=1 Tax=unclassified Mesorhizobium TaxID=325217 RepID=UPI000BAEAABB|nr:MULTISPECIES: transporter substrate-binding domain-containing protein [unclassified Mesorhizobium]PBB24364.1 amino acid ABC transporter substrate-binding protein [Mesorhizobium sp. WSM4304]PBB74668.1 amino acid ABC transporter substrate-binding protein [Mesorhizobium sp. WSM4308]